ncbi:MAG: MFS transporter [Kofleriaceae bacterium]
MRSAVVDDSRRVVERLVAARALATLGRAVISATAMWELYARTSSTLVLGSLGLVQVIPVIALFVPAGRLVDRVDRRLLTTAASACAGTIGIGLAMSSALDAPVPVYLVLLLAQGGVTSVNSPASATLIPLIVPRDQLIRTNRLNSSLSELSWIVGPAVAGLALKWIAPGWIYAAVAVFACASALLYRSLPAPRAIDDRAAGNREDWRVGLRYIFGSKLLLPALTLDMFAVLFAGTTALLPAIALDVLHTDSLGFGILRAAQSAGAVAMALLGGRIPPWRHPGRVLLIVVALFGAATIGVGLSRSLPLTVVVLFACGVLDNISVVIRLTLEQMVVPDAIRGRVSAVHFVFIGMSNELGAAESGLAARLVGIAPAVVIGGAIAMIVVGFVAVRWPELARMPPLAELEP